eukprot:8798117-Heterocapsa_arctica.AAC.1
MDQDILIEQLERFRAIAQKAQEDAAKAQESAAQAKKESEIFEQLVLARRDVEQARKREAELEVEEARR